MSALNSLLGGVSTLALFIVVCVCAALFFGSLLAWAICMAAKQGDEARARAEEQARRQALAHARQLAETQAAIAEVEMFGQTGRDLERAMLNHSYTVMAVQRIDALLAGDEDHARHIEQGQQALVNALRHLESRPEPTVRVGARSLSVTKCEQMVNNAKWN